MRILITGATGFIGRRLISHLQYQHDLVVLSRKPHNAYSVLGHNLHTTASLDEYPNLDNFDAVINLAGEPIAARRWSTQQKQRICQSRWQLTEQLNQKLQAGLNPPSVVISGSATGYYGEQGDNIIDETFTPSENSFLTQICQRWESEALKMQSSQTRVCILRTGIVLGREGGALAKMLPAFKCGLGGPMGSGRQYIPWIHIDDMVNAILFLLSHTQCQGMYNITAPTPVTNSEFSQSLAQILHRPAIFRLPTGVMNALFGEMAQLLVEGQRAVPSRLLAEDFGFKYHKLEPALRELLHHDCHRFKNKLFY